MGGVVMFRVAFSDKAYPPRSYQVPGRSKCTKANVYAVIFLNIKAGHISCTTDFSFLSFSLVSWSLFLHHICRTVLIVSLCTFYVLSKYFCIYLQFNRNKQSTGSIIANKILCEYWHTIYYWKRKTVFLWLAI